MTILHIARVILGTPWSVLFATLTSGMIRMVRTGTIGYVMTESTHVTSKFVNRRCLFLSHLNVPLKTGRLLYQTNIALDAELSTEEGGSCGFCSLSI